MFLYFVIAALVVYCIVSTSLLHGEIKDIRRSLGANSDIISHYLPIWDKNIDTINDLQHKIYDHSFQIDDCKEGIEDLQANVEKANEVFSDIWDRIDAIIDKLLDVRVENILRERDALEAKYRELLQKHNDLAAAYDEYKNKHPDRSYIPVAKPDYRVTTCELKIEGDDFVDISDRKDEAA